MQSAEIQASEGFRYHPLSANEIRLVKLKGGQGSKTVECEIFHANLDEKPFYRALSYVWGSAENKAIIKLNGEDFPVTRNLASALLHLRIKDADHIMWIDALCIDQGSVADKSQQVPQMGRIYKNADTVVAWLGDAYEESDQAVDLLREIAQTFNSSEHFSQPITPESMKANGFDADSKNWPALWRLWSRPYWTRMWIVQEQLFAGNTWELVEDRCIIGVGHRWEKRLLYKIGLTFLVQCMQNSDAFSPNWKAARDDPSQRREPLRSLFNGFEDLPARGFQGALMAAEVLQLQPDRARSLVFLLRSTRTFECSDQRDRIYALAGIFAPNDPTFVIDYEASFQIALQNAFQHSVHKCRNLTLLAGNRKVLLDDQPSWLPDNRTWHRPSAPAWDSIDRHHACGDFLLQNLRIDHERGLLHLRGILVGVINHVQDFHTDEDASQEDRTAKDEQTIARARQFWDTLDETRRDGFWRTLIFNQDRTCDSSNMSPAPAELRSQFEIAMLGRSNAAFEEFEPQLDVMTRMLAFFERWRLNTDQTLQNHCFFDTDTQFMGMGPYLTQPGDHVVILEGGDFLFVLRPHAEKFQVLGEAWALNAMEGQLVQKDENGDFAGVRELVLC